MKKEKLKHCVKKENLQKSKQGNLKIGKNVALFNFLKINISPYAALEELFFHQILVRTQKRGHNENNNKLIRRFFQKENH